VKKYLPTIITFTVVIGVIALGIWYSDKDSPIKELAKLNIYSKEELSFLEEQGFLDNLDNVDTEKISNSQEVIKAFKSPTLIEQNFNSPDESFEVLATKLDKDNYQLAFKLENKSQEKKEFYLIPVSERDQLEFKEIKGVINNKNLLSINRDDVKKELSESLYDIKQHKKELNPKLAQAYDDIAHNNYQAKPIKITLASNSTLLAQSKWQIKGDRVSDSLEPVYLLVYGSAGGAKEELTILNVHSHPQQGESWEVSFTTKGTNDLKIIPNDQATIDDDEFTGLFCDNEERSPQILQGDVIYYPDWKCNGTGKVVHYTLTAGRHTLRFEFGDQIKYAYNAVVKGVSSGFVTSAPSADPAGIAGKIDTRAFALKAVAPAGAAKVVEIGWWCDTATEEANFEVAIYDHNVGDNNPEAIVGWDQTNAKGTTAGWKKVTGLDIPITAGNTYWIAVQLDDTATQTNYNYTNDAGEKEDMKTTQTTLIDPWGVSPYTYGELTGFYAVWEAANAAPTISSVADYPDPEKVGNDITFSVDWDDEGDEVKIHICKTDTLSGYACQTNQVWCETGTASDDDPETCTYSTTSGDIGSNTYYAFVCDDEDSCSNYTSSTFTVEAVSTPSMIIK